MIQVTEYYQLTQLEVEAFQKWIILLLKNKEGCKIQHHLLEFEICTDKKLEDAITELDQDDERDVDYTRPSVYENLIKFMITNKQLIHHPNIHTYELAEELKRDINIDKILK